ncbi:MAG: hypothetical protein WAM97_12635 [Acidimicrobiales bacterium]
MHPSVLISLTEQRLADLRDDRHPKKVSGRSRRRSGSGPVGRVETKVGAWMVSAGWGLVRNGNGTPPQLRPLPFSR